MTHEIIVLALPLPWCQGAGPKISIENRISEVFECEKIVPPAGQGTIVIQSREDDDKLNNILSKINHFETSIEAKIERKILSVLEGDCNTAAGIYANVKGDKDTKK